MSRVACLVRHLPYFSHGVRAGPVFSAPRVGVESLPPNAAQLLTQCGWSRGLARGSPDPGRQVSCSASPGFLTSLLRRPGLLHIIFYLNLVIFPQTCLKSCAPPPRSSGVRGDEACQCHHLAGRVGSQGLPGAPGVQTTVSLPPRHCCHHRAVGPHPEVFRAWGRRSGSPHVRIVQPPTACGRLLPRGVPGGSFGDDGSKDCGFCIHIAGRTSTRSRGSWDSFSASETSPADA